MFVSYKTLSHKERRAAKKRAKTLLWTDPVWGGELIARLKVMQEHYREKIIGEHGVDVGEVEPFCVRHETFGWRCMLLDKAKQSLGAAQFAEIIAKCGECEMDTLDVARALILEDAPRFAFHPLLIVANKNCSGRDVSAVRVLYGAAAFLIKNGFWSVDQNDMETIITKYCDHKTASEQLIGIDQPTYEQERYHD